jgi:hypothetical protein
MDSKELKQTIRRLKKLELMSRYGFSKEYLDKNTSTQFIDKLPLVWKDFFDLAGSNPKARYSISSMKAMDKEQVKQVIGEFWFMVYYKMYCEKGNQMTDIQAPELLSYLGLPFDADHTAVRKRFRELYKVCHPDEGGAADKFIELMRMKEKYEIK